MRITDYICLSYDNDEVSVEGAFLKDRSTKSIDRHPPISQIDVTTATQSLDSVWDGECRGWVWTAFD